MALLRDGCGQSYSVWWQVSVLLVDGVIWYGLSRADEERQRTTTQREMRHGFCEFCPFFNQEFTVFLPSVQNLTCRIRSRDSDVNHFVLTDSHWGSWGFSANVVCIASVQGLALRYGTFLNVSSSSSSHVTRTRCDVVQNYFFVSTELPYQDAIEENRCL